MAYVSKRFKDAMIVGVLFDEQYRKDPRVKDWTNEKHISEFCDMIFDTVTKGIDVVDEFYEYADEIINIINKLDDIEVYKWNSANKGFIAGHILGEPTEDNINKVRKANDLWETRKYRSYVDALLEVS